MAVSEWVWKARDGLKMYARGWIPENPKAVVCLVHGHGEHVNRYQHMGQAFIDAGYVLRGFDIRGHGQSGGQRGHTASYESLLDDIDDFLADAQKRYAGLPLFLYGHSMGGNQVVNYVLRYSKGAAPDGIAVPKGLHGILLGSPWLRLTSEPAAFQWMLAQLMNILFPSFSQPTGLEQTALSRDPGVVSGYATDPLVHDKVSMRLFTLMCANGLSALEHAAALQVPTLLMHGSADRLTSPDASKKFAEVAGDIVTLRIWDGFYHELHNEPEKADVMRVMTDWIDEHL